MFVLALFVVAAIEVAVCNPPASSSDQPQVVQCPGGQYVCPDGSTCCRNAAGAFTCCPQVNAVCCADKTTCCPRGYKCWEEQRVCIKGYTETAQKMPSIMAASRIDVSNVDSQNVKCPGGKYDCPSGSTCCPNTAGNFNCCPQIDAVCCMDKVTCCPPRYLCWASEKLCVKSPTQRIEHKQPSKVLENQGAPVPSLKCPDNTECFENDPCCKAAGNEYKCCPHEQGVCCKGGDKCCPQGYICIEETGGCLIEYGAAPWGRSPRARNTY